MFYSGNNKIFFIFTFSKYAACSTIPKRLNDSRIAKNTLLTKMWHRKYEFSKSYQSLLYRRVMYRTYVFNLRNSDFVFVRLLKRNENLVNQLCIVYVCGFLLLLVLLFLFKLIFFTYYTHWRQVINDFISINIIAKIFCTRTAKYSGKKTNCRMTST